MNTDRVIVVGASIGGVLAFRQLLSPLPTDFAAPILIVQHIDGHQSVLPDLLGRMTRLPIAFAQHGQRIQAGRIYVAPPDRHLTLDQDELVLTQAAKEHHTRPAIDPLFRSAAASRGPDVIGIVLSGGLSDGAQGLLAIKRAGGTAVVQHPADAEAEGMPLSALNAVTVDHCLPADEIGACLQALVAGRECRRRP
ncbi:MAG: chemotaxis protein CheB [Gammaproteobacteria bacterium]|nr:chemotaxis protein CheB [Gammaproteobacteria bacterium]